ncbi:MAG: histidine triad (HIT) family protein [Pseudohongiellaceae bacterium]|jgi:histidine triad (HIT) family protein
MTDCIFCKIIAKEAQASIVYEDENFMAFMDAYPLTDGHCLIIPKSHVIRLDDIKASQRAKLFNIGHKIVEAQKKIGLGIQGTNFLVNDGKAANQTVPHLHLHLIPRSSGDWLKSLPKIILHITGLFGLKTAAKKLDEQAANIAKHMK